MDDANTLVQIIDNPELVPTSKPIMIIRFDDWLPVDIQGVLDCLMEAGYTFKGIQSGHYSRRIATFEL